MLIFYTIVKCFEMYLYFDKLIFFFKSLILPLIGRKKMGKQTETA